MTPGTILSLENNVWKAKLTIQTSLDSYMIFFLEAPSQTSVLELVRIYISTFRKEK